jgi:hypothetical protein
MQEGFIMAVGYNGKTIPDSREEKSWTTLAQAMCNRMTTNHDIRASYSEHPSFESLCRYKLL